MQYRPISHRNEQLEAWELKEYRSQMDWVSGSGQRLVPPSHLIAAKSDHGIDPGCSSGWQPHRDDGHGCDDGDGNGEGGWIHRGETEELLTDDPGCGECERQSQRKADREEQEGFTEDHPHDRWSMGAEGKADADLVRAADDVVADNAVQADGGKEYGEQGEDAGEGGDELVIGDETRDLVVDSDDVKQGQIAIDRDEGRPEIGDVGRRISGGAQDDGSDESIVIFLWRLGRRVLFCGNRDWLQRLDLCDRDIGHPNRGCPARIA
jgi:hypothetical protein